MGSLQELQNNPSAIFCLKYMRINIFFPGRISSCIYVDKKSNKNNEEVE